MGELGLKRGVEVKTECLQLIHGTNLCLYLTLTSYNTIEFPAYETKEQLKQKLDYALDFAMGVWGDA